MTEGPGIQDEEQICSLDSLRKLCEKRPKVLLIPTNEDRSDFAQKFADGAASDDLTVVEVQAGGSCEAVKELGLKDASTAVFIENGEVKSRIALQNDDVLDTAALLKTLSAKPSEGDSCKAELIIDEYGWKLKPESGSPCERELSNLPNLTPAVKKYLTKHIESNHDVLC